jgi:hypothetical protein
MPLIGCQGTLYGGGGRSRDCVRSEVLAMQQAVEQALDPMDLFNPGEVVGMP